MEQMAQYHLVALETLAPTQGGAAPPTELALPAGQGVALSGDVAEFVGQTSAVPASDYGTNVAYGRLARDRSKLE